MWLGVSPLSCPPPNTQTTIPKECVVGCTETPTSLEEECVVGCKHSSILEEECVVGCKPAVMPSSPNTQTTFHTRGGVCGWV